MNNRLVRRQVDGLVEAAHPPIRRPIAQPVDRMRRPGTASPAPALIVPEFGRPVAARIDEFGEFGVGHGRTRHSKRRNGYRVRPFFVVEHERRVLRVAEHEGAAGDRGIAWQGAGAAVFRVARRQREDRFAIAEALPGIGIGFGMHVFMEGRELIQIAVLHARHAVFQPFQQGVLHGGHVGKRIGDAKQRQIPARIVGDGDRIVYRVAIGQQSVAAVNAPQDEIFVEPRNMADFPLQRIDRGQLGPDKLFGIQTRDQFQGPDAGVAHVVAQNFGRHRLGHFPRLAGLA